MIQPSKEDLKADGEKYVAKALILLHSPETRDGVVKMLTGPDPVQRVSNVLVMVMQRVDSEARKSNLEVQDVVKAAAARAIVPEIVEIGEAAKLFNLNPDLELLAFSVSLQDYLKAEIKAGRVDSKKLAVTMQADVRSMPPKMRKEVIAAQPRIQQIARKYAHGAGMASFQTSKTGE